MQIIIIIELLIIICLLSGSKKEPPALGEKETPADLRAEQQQKAWNDGLSSILSYDMMKARGAVRRDDE